MGKEGRREEIKVREDQEVGTITKGMSQCERKVQNTPHSCLRLFSGSQRYGKPSYCPTFIFLKFPIT